VLVISSDLPEVVGIADRVVVMREGETRGEVAGPAITEESIMALATGVEIDKVAA
jgi:ribose transport system ATP-binding protein